MAELAIDWPSLLREFRQTRGLKQEAAAAHFGVSQASISRWESGAVAPTVGVRNRLFKALRRARSPIDTADWVSTFRRLYGPGAITTENKVVHAVTGALADHVGAPREVIEGLRLDQIFRGEALDVAEEVRANGAFAGRLARIEACIRFDVDPCIQRNVSFWCHYIAWPHFIDGGAIVLVSHGGFVSEGHARDLKQHIGGALSYALAD